MILSQKDLEAIKDGSLTIDCPSMKLVPVVEGGREQYLGSGFIALDRGGLSFKLLSSQDYSFRDLVLESPSKSGQLFEDIDYFFLYARDVSGRSWRSTRILPEFTSGSGLAIAGKIEEILATEEIEVLDGRAVLKMWFYGDLGFPFNRSSMSVKYIGEAAVSESWSVTCADFKSEGYNFSAMLDNDWSRLEVEGDSIPGHLSSRVEESLEFMLAHSVRASVVEAFEGAKVEVSIRSVKLEPVVAGPKAPLVRSSPNYRRQGWDLFSKFFRYVLAYEESSRPPISRILQYVVQMRLSPIDAQALALGVAVEGLLAEVYSGLGEPCDELVREIDKAVALVEGSDLSVKARISGSIQAMKRSRPKDRLLSLVAANTITKDQYTAWEKLRNSTAHAVVHHPDNKFLNLYSRVLVLFHCLIFSAIEYSGPFTDYGMPGWPEKIYPFNEVVGVAAEPS